MAKCEGCGKYTPFAYCDMCTFRDPSKFHTDNELISRRPEFRSRYERKLYMELIKDAKGCGPLLGSDGLRGDGGD